MVRADAVSPAGILIQLRARSSTAARACADAGRVRLELRRLSAVELAAQPLEQLAHKINSGSWTAGAGHVVFSKVFGPGQRDKPPVPRHRDAAAGRHPDCGAPPPHTLPPPPPTY